MVTRYGFSEKLGPILYGSENDEVFLGRDYGHGKNYSENVASEIDAEIREFIETGYEKAKDILTVHGDLLELCAQYLIKHEKLDGPVFYKLMNGEIDVDGNPTKLVEEKTEMESRRKTAKIKISHKTKINNSVLPKAGRNFAEREKWH